MRTCVDFRTAGCCQVARLSGCRHLGQPRNIERSQPMSFKRLLQASTYEFWQRHGSAMRTMMKPGSMMNLARVMVRVRAGTRVRIRVTVRVRARVKVWG